MIEQLKTIRAFIRRCADGDTMPSFAATEALTALAQLEAMVGEQEPVAWMNPHTGTTLSHKEKLRFLSLAGGRNCQGQNDEEMKAYAAAQTQPLYAAPPAQQYEAGDMASAAAQGFRDGVASVAQQPQQEPVAWMANFTNRYGNADVYVTTHKHLAIENDEHGTPRPLVFGDAAPPAQQPQAEPDDEILKERDDAEDFIDMLLDEVLGTDRPEWTSAYDRNDALRDVQERMTALHKPMVDKAWERFEKAQQPQAEAVPVVDRVYEAAKRLVDHADFQLGGVLSAKSKARDIPSNAASKVKARHLASLRDALAKAPYQAEAVPSDVVCAVAAEREACARQCEDIYSWRGAYSAGPMCARTLEAAAAAIRARGHAAIAQQKGGV